MSRRSGLRPLPNVDYNSESKSDTVYTVGSASKWEENTSNYMNIKVNDVQGMFPEGLDLPDEAKLLMVPEWTNEEWLTNVNIKALRHDNKIKTLIGKIRKVCLSKYSMTEVIVDGFMNSLLNILCFDDYPCSLYPQYSYSAKIGPKNHTVNAKPDFSVLSEDKIMLVIEDKTITSATYANQWKEYQVLGELFAAAHFVVANSKVTVIYPVTVYAVRVIGTKFTFYKADVTLEYIKESARLGLSVSNEMVVQRYPPVKDDPSGLTAYDICNKDDRVRILECLCYIRRSIC